MNRAEAIKIIKAATVYTPEEMEALETLIPELNESEEEKIRKWIYNLVSNLDPQNDDAEKELDEMKPLALAWLEKQKDASKAIEAVERIDKYIDEHVANAHDMKDSNSEKEYYLGWDAALGKMSGILQDVYSGEKQKEQKPAEWSEEDKQWLSEVYFVIDHSMYSEDERQAMKKYIDSLRSQSKTTEWSEEDEKMRKEIELVVSGVGITVAGMRSKMLRWLKSLRPSWRPSEDEECKNSK